MYIITIDTGTTNTRVCVWKDDKFLAESSRPVGVKSTAISGSTVMLEKAVSDAIREAESLAQITHQTSKTYLAAGMITSNVGLYEIPHILAPAGPDDLAAGMVSKRIQSIVQEPIWFVPGVKNDCAEVSVACVDQMDIMRGEETEAIGLIEVLNINGPALIILPGSHSKFVKIDSNNRIEGCLTTIGGELIDVITRNTILSDSLKHEFANEVETNYVLQGAALCNRVGLSRACFSIRVLDLFADLSTNQKANVLLGAVLADDLKALKNCRAFQVSPDMKIVVCGKRVLKEAFSLLIGHDEWFAGELISAPEIPSLSGHGLLALAKRKQLI